MCTKTLDGNYPGIPYATTGGGATIQVNDTLTNAPANASGTVTSGSTDVSASISFRAYFSQEFNYTGTLPSPDLSVSNIDGYAEITAMGGQFTSARVFSKAGDVSVSSITKRNVPSPGPHTYAGGGSLITDSFTLQATAGGSASGVGNSFTASSGAELVYTL